VGKKASTSKAMSNEERAARLTRLRRRRALLTMTLALGICVFLYPIAARMYNQYRFVKLAESYTQTMMDEPDEAKEAMWSAARAYNVGHRVNNIEDPFGDGPESDASVQYASLLDPMGNGLMGYLDIPRIEQRLNIYHGTDEDALLEGVGHLEGTSLPVGGDSTHCVLSAHRGLPAAKLFTDLDQLREGDVVYLRVLDRTLAYRVDGSEVVEPSDIDSLAIAEGQDLLTLVTCTPYAINTHRLLVRAHAVAYHPEEDQTVNIGLLVRARLALVCAGVAVSATIAFMAAGRLAVRVSPDELSPRARHLS